MKSDKTLSREELYELVWTTPMVRLAKQFGLSDQGLAKKCKKHNIPRPPQGYWVKLEHGKSAKKTPLPCNSDSSLESIAFYTKFEVKQSLSAPQNENEEEQLVRALEYKIPVKVNRYHPLVSAYRKAADKKYIDQYGHILCRGTAIGQDIKVTQDAYKRACHFIQGIISLFGDCGWQLKEQTSQWSSKPYVAFVFGDDELRFKLKERVKRTPHIKTKKEKDSGYSWGPTYDYIPTGTLELSIENLYSPGFKTHWKDTNKETLEDQLASIVQGFSRGFECHKQLRLEREREHRIWKVEEEKRKEALRLQKIEVKRQEYLFELAQDHQKAEQIRNLIQAFQATGEKGNGFDDWLSWATEIADSFDPIERAAEIVSKHHKIAQESYHF